MRNLWLFLFLISFTANAQVTISGTVISKDGFLEDAAVYVNNSMIGTTTDKNGRFQLPLKKGKYELIISFLGYKKIIYPLNTETYSKPIKFVLIEDEDVLDGIVLKNNKYDDVWKNNLLVFKQEFLGISEFAKECEILNEKDLFFDYNKIENRLLAFSKKPLKIKNKALGYLVTYDLESFERGNTHVSYLGYTRYEELKGSKRKKRKWREARLKAYLGSQTHFFKSLVDKDFKEKGYIVNQFKRVPNPERPTDEEIEKARAIVKQNKGFIINLNKNFIPKTKVDSAFVTLKKASLPKFKDYLYKSKLNLEDIADVVNDTVTLIFENNLSVVYTKETEETGYLRRNRYSLNREPMAQTSELIPMQRPLKIDNFGHLYNPLQVFYEGYWSYEKFAHTLPLYYKPGD